MGVSKDGAMMHIADGGLACLAMRGNVPLKVVVSRGVESASSEFFVEPEDVQQYGTHGHMASLAVCGVCVDISVYITHRRGV